MSYRYLVIASCLLLTTPAFAQDYENRTMSDRLDHMERDLQLLQRQIARGEPVEGDDNTQTYSTGHGSSDEARLGALEEQMRSLRGQLEQQDHKTRTANERLDKIQKDMEARFDALEHSAPVKTERGVDVAPAAKEEEKPGFTTTAEVRDSETPPTGDVVQSLNKKKPVDEQAAAGMKFDNPRDHYNYAFKLLRQSKHEEAGNAFESFIATYPKDPLVGNAYYWLGETWYVRREYVKAADSFRQGFEVMPSGPKAADNLLKLAMSLSATKEDDKACVVLKQLVKKFGDNSTTVKQKAEAEISRLRCE